MQKTNFRNLNNIQLIFEPGNCIVRDCAEYHSKIVRIKTCENTNYIVADGSSLHIPKFNQNTSIDIERNQSKSNKFYGTKIYGNTCKESDLIYKFDKSIEIGIGDEIVIKNIGAYSLNEINPMILGYPEIYINNTEQRILGNKLFTILCHYSDFNNSQKQNNYSLIYDKANQKGLYAFVKSTGEIIYIGVSHDKNVSNRIIQHFQNGFGSIRHKLSSTELAELEDCDLYIWLNNLPKQSLLFEEANLIGLYKPKYNYL